MAVNKVTTIQEAISHVKDGDRIMVGGFGLRGCPDDLIDALVAAHRKNLTIISNDLGSPNIGLGRLLTENCIKALIGTFYNWNYDVAEAKNSGRIEATLLFLRVLLLNPYVLQAVAFRPIILSFQRERNLEKVKKFINLR